MSEDFDRENLDDWRRGVNCGCLTGIILSAAAAFIFYYIRWGVTWSP